ncbi:class I SAM-dependent rRNA methyltransferase [Candidatus Protochlamydia phocaeensis]|uniref:class I SAM-dependent rRNA methyltransferase n=1 Tax=Candidatus Protochlamydia phocaeensis TaxID=1414722 RepID=UPI0008397BBC|nr:class I SAM-dependent rRNA methyltransferase [Candidatus Protochlamydia phocaeensis]
MQSKGVILKPGKDKAIRHRHHWIFSGAVQSFPSFKEGDFLPVYASDGQFLGSGYFNRQSGIVGRMVAFDQTPPLQKIEQHLLSAWELRKNWFDLNVTNAFRLINGEGDGLPGLIIDVYDQVFVIQCSTKGMDKLKPWLVETLNKHFHPKTIYEKSLLPSRKEEGLKDEQGFLAGEEKEEVSFKENGLIFTTNLAHSQKTGFFLDHREMRQWIGTLAKGKSVLNAFSYTGGFSVYALAGEAQLVDSVDISQEAIETAKRHATLNQLDKQSQHYYCADVFAFLREHSLDYDLVILDPPAFAKRQKDIVAACRGYKDINRLAMQKMPARSLLLTCSCSHYVNEDLFQKVLFQAAWEAKRFVRIIGRHRLAIDHPINLYHPESHYLKSFLLYIE